VSITNDRDRATARESAPHLIPIEECITLSVDVADETRRLPPTFQVDPPATALEKQVVKLMERSCAKNARVLRQTSEDLAMSDRGRE
jgi:hypothetical protein